MLKTLMGSHELQSGGSFAVSGESFTRQRRKFRLAVAEAEDISVCAEELMLDNETKESYVHVSSSEASCYVCQLPQNSINCVDFPQESHPSGSQLVCMPEMSAVSQSEAPQSPENQILEPIPLLVKEELKDEELKNGSSSQSYGATVKQNSRTSLSESPHFENLHSSQFGVNGYQDNASFRPCNLPESQVATSTGIDLTSMHMRNVLGGEKDDTVNENLSSGRCLFMDSGMHNLQNKVKLESCEEASNQHPCNRILEDLQKQTSDSPDGFTTDNLLACTMLISPSGYDTVNRTEDASTHSNLESKRSCCQTSVSEDKSAVFEKERIQLNSDNQIADSSLSSSLLSVKIEPEECNNSESDSQINPREHLSSSKCFLDKTSMLTPCASQLCSEAVNCEQFIFSVATTTYPPEVDLPLPKKMQTCFDANKDVVNSVSSAAIKAEPFDGNPEKIAPENPGKCLTAYEFSLSPLEVKVDPLEMVKAPAKTEVIQELSVDIIDHIPLQERLKMIISSRDPEFKTCDGPKTFHNSVQSASSTSVTDPVSLVGNIYTNSVHGRKRKKTATDSVETALEEDAPALLQVLIENGIDLKMIKLYEVMDDNGTLDASSEDNFNEFENVILKLFSERPSSLFKLCKLHKENGTKATYCLACLTSLIEQTRYMQFRNCPVEWGWCRDLQSFIFIFEKHNRIVLERPEYGYATYFFELVDSFPIAWQIKRLITAMKLAKYSRITLIENKSLMVGEDLTEGEARILKEYGWKPNSGLGSFLNFCDRVVHDRRNEMDNSDWRCKIGKLLKNGYDSGRIVTPDLPKKVVEYINNQQQAIKLELDV